MVLSTYFSNIQAAETELGVPEDKQTYCLTHPQPSNLGVLAIHGFLADPSDTRVLGEHLHADAGASVLGIRLPGHGTSPADLDHYQWHQWVTACQEAYDVLRSNYESVIIYGVSMGALMGLQLASKKGPAGLICVGSILVPVDWRLRWGGVLGQMVPWVMKTVFGIHAIQSSGADPNNYDRISLTGALELHRMMKNTRPTLSSVTCPLMIIHSETDTVAHPSSANILFDHVGSQDKHLLWAKGRHTLLTERDDNNHSLYQDVVTFCQDPSDYFFELSSQEK